MIIYEDLYGKLAIIALTIACFVFFYLKKKEGKDWVYAAYFTFVLIVGTILYCFALSYNNDAEYVFSPYFMILSSLSFSMSSFIGNFNVQSAYSCLAIENTSFKWAIIVHFLAAVSLTFLAVVKLFGKKVLNEICVWWISLWGKYIVIGCDNQAGIFLKNLNNKQRKRTIVIIQPEQIAKTWELIARGYAVVTVKKMNNDNIYKALKKAGAMRCKRKTKIISMSEQDEVNLLVARIMTDYIDKEVKPQKNDKGRIKLTSEQEAKISKIKLDVHVMYNLLERAEHFSYIEYALGRVRFFNPHEIRARKFLWKNPITKLIPSHWIDTEKARLKDVSKGGNEAYKVSNIFVGFGSTNKAILKASIVNNQLLNVNYNALIISQDAEMQEKIFMNSAIGLFGTAEIKSSYKKSTYLESPKEKNNIVFEKADALSVGLYDRIIKEIDGGLASNDENSKSTVLPCDYATVIIALGNDKLSVETALELRQKLYEADLLFSKNGDIKYQCVKIFIKINKKTIFADNKILNCDAGKNICEINVFGADEEVLTEEYIIDEKLDILAKNIANRYEGNVETAIAASEWNTCTQLKRESNRYAAMAIRVKLNLLGLDLVERDESPKFDCSSLFNKRYETDTAFDFRVKRKKLEKAIFNARKEEKENRVAIPKVVLELKIEDEIIDLAKRDNEDFADTSRNNLAKLEHLRWNAFHLANDWTKFPIEKIGVGRDGRQDEIAKQHACITTFHGLAVLRDIQKNVEKVEIEENKEKRYIEAESLLNADTIRHDFSTMDFLLIPSEENVEKLRNAEEKSNEKYTGILTGSGYHICEFKEAEE